MPPEIVETPSVIPGEPQTEYSNLPPPSLIDDIQTQLSVIFNSSAAQHRGKKSKAGAGTNDLSLVVYCPLEGGESVVDSTVQELARGTNATVQTIDLVQLIGKQPGTYWKNVSTSDMDEEDGSASESEKSSSDSSDSNSDDEDGKPAGYFKMRKPIDVTKLASLTEVAIAPHSNNVPCLDNQPGTDRRIIYLRDIGFMATFAPECYRNIVATVYEQQLRGSATSGASHSVPTVVIIGASPLLVNRGLFQKEPPKKKSSSRDSSPGILSLLKSLRSQLEAAKRALPDFWGECQRAKELRAQRLRQQHGMWDDGTLVAHIHKQLAGTGLMGEVKRGRSSRSKHVPTCIVVPAKRNLEQERFAREKRRLELNKLQIRMALLGAGGELRDIDGLADLDNKDKFTDRCREQIIKVGDTKRVADRVVSTALAASSTSDRPAFVPVSWDDCCKAWAIQEERDQERTDWLKKSKPTGGVESEDGDSSSSSSDDDRSEANESRRKTAGIDPLVEKLKKSVDSRQKTMLGCLVSPGMSDSLSLGLGVSEKLPGSLGDIQSGFDAVHLPESTIETVRTLVSLRLVCPQAFETGILKQYNMSGALLFGPPGTGKTLLAKAIAKESGARMLSIKPSDILDKCVGEEEKNIDALFKVAQQLKPCVIFIDEVDALFGARVSARDEKSARWRTDMLTQFTQEMDGMLSSDITVIGATNRPFDLDDAVIRRLPCRILVDLPEKDAREAILRILLKDEQLDSDVSLSDLASLTPHFSGSDLKHVCVMAAFESAKELAEVSWVDKKEKRSTSVLSALGISSPVSDSGERSLLGSTLDARFPEGLAAFASVITKEKEDQLTSIPQTRKLSKRHFTQALKQIRASTSETQTSLVELRRWNEQFGSGSQSSKTGGYGIPGSNLTGLNRPGMNASGMNASGMKAPWMNASGMHRPGMSGLGAEMPGMNILSMGMPSMNMHGVNTPGVDMSGVNAPSMNYVPPVEGSYLRSLGIQR
ncbi:hypothetical protein FRC11_006183 [Ceratobasidium sp. 423]|nr:hypothetical protein FRC11_006183 [Ceratobasidium sp. 423]